MTLNDNAIAELFKQCNEGKITPEELKQKLGGAGRKVRSWDTAHERNPRYPESNNQSRESFIYNPFNHQKGQFFQQIVKTAIKKAIDFAHNAMLKKYDKEAYIYDDPRLQALEKFAKEYIEENFQDAPDYKPIFMKKIMDIVLGLAKEDIYYRARMFDMLNEFMKQGQPLELTDAEKENLKRMRMKEYYCQKCQVLHNGIPPLAVRTTEGKYLYKCG